MVLCWQKSVGLRTLLLWVPCALLFIVFSGRGVSGKGPTWHQIQEFLEVMDGSEDAEILRLKRDLLEQIKASSSKDLGYPSGLGPSFSEGFIDSGSKDAVEEGAASLGFVFDTTGSMKDDLKQVRQGASKILRTILEKFDRPIHNYILVPFADVDYSRAPLGPVTVTTDPDEFQDGLSLISVHGGVDCPESSVAAIGKALDLCLPSSYIYVFTDASAKDYYLLDEVLRLIQKKQTQVVFVLTGDCGNRTHPGYTAYEKIASTSTGQVFHLDKSDVEEVLNFVRISLESRKVNLLSLDRESFGPGEENLELVVDDTLKEFTVSVAGEKPKVEILAPPLKNGQRVESKVEELLALENVRIVGVRKPHPGRYNISVGSEGKFTVRATGLSSIDFEHGFSLKPTTNIKETYHRPRKGGTSYLLLRPKDPTEFGTLSKVQVVDLEGNILEDLPLERLPGPEILFNATSPFQAPESSFRIKISGYDSQGFPFDRISPTAITSQLPFKPEVTAKEKVFGYFDQPVSIKCYVQTLVPFSLEWQKNGISLASNINHPQSAEVEWIIEDPQREDEGYYTCIATNLAGNASASVFLDIKEPPPVITAAQNASVSPEQDFTLTCDVESTVEHNVTWFRYQIQGQMRDFFGKTETIGKFIKIDELGGPRRPYQLAGGRYPYPSLTGGRRPFPSYEYSWDGRRDSATQDNRYIKLVNNSLLLRNVERKDEGWFRCVAANEGGQVSREIYLSVQSPPEVSVIPEVVIFKAEENFSASCIARGFPEPKVYWRKGDEVIDGSSSSQKVTVDKDRTLRVTRAQPVDEGRYTCVAQSSAGKAEASVDVTFIEEPKVLAVEQEVLIKSGDTATLQCYAEGTPPPQVMWFKDGTSRITPMTFIKVEDGYLRISGVQERDAGTYTCVASNAAGSAQDDIILKVGAPPTVVQPPEDTTIELGARGGMVCYGRGVPPPTVTWSRRDGKPLSPHVTHDGKGGLRVTEMTVEDEGEYECRLANDYGVETRVARLTVSGLLPPLIAAPPTPQVQAIVGKSVALECAVVIANPPPLLQWNHNGRLITPGKGTHVDRTGTLQLFQVALEDEGSYQCTATNVAGNSSMTLYLDVLVPPRVSEDLPQEKVVTRGDTVRLECPVAGDPRPTISWQRNGQPILPFQRRPRVLRQGTLVIRGVRPSDNAVYVCTATNRAGVTNQAITLTVHDPPNIKVGPSSYSLLEGETLDVPCEAGGFPPPSVTWTRPQQGLVLDSNFKNESDRQEAGGGPVEAVLSILASPETEGEYECVASNVAGTAKRSINISVSSPPVILPPGDEVLSVSAGEDLKLPCEASGYPEPEVRWDKDQWDISNDLHHSIGEDFLLLKNVTPEMSGIYICAAINRARTVSKAFDITVKYPPKIKEEEIDSPRKSLVEGEGFSLPCPAEANPAPDRTWTKDGLGIDTGDASLTVTEEGTVEVNRAAPRHSGSYTCNLENPLGRNSINYEVKVLVPPRVNSRRRPDRPVVVEGNGIKIECPIDAVPFPTVSWFKDGVSIFSTKDRADMTHIIIEEAGQTLHILEATMDDKGVYKCVASNPAGQTEIEVPLDVQLPPQFTDFFHTPEVVLKLGEEILLDCEVYGDPAPQMSWRHDGLPVYTGLHKDGQQLFVPKARLSDGGLYTCTASSVAGTASRNFSVVIHVAPSLQEGETPVAVVEVITGRDAQLLCHTGGVPAPDIEWTKDGVPLEHLVDLEHELNEDGEVLTLKRVDGSHSGMYRCLAANIAGSVTKDFNFTVLTPPTLTYGPEGSDVVEEVRVVGGQGVMLSCEVGGYPKPAVLWLKNGRPIATSQRLHVLEAEELLISKTEESDSGTYSCLATNRAGTAERQFSLQVLVPPRITLPGGMVGEGSTPQEVLVDMPFTLMCPAQGSPDPVINWTKDNQPIEAVIDLAWGLGFGGRGEVTDYGQRFHVFNANEFDSGKYTCEAKNEAGAVNATYDVKVLVPPMIITKDNTSYSVLEDEEVSIDCEVLGEPPPTHVWTKDGVALPELHLEGVQVSFRSPYMSRVLIPRANVLHVGTYTCIASSVAGVDEVQFTVSVATTPTPETSQETQELRVKLNRPATLTCRIRGTPQPVYTWFKNDEALDLNETKVQLRNGGRELNIIYVGEDDRGNYTCIASNDAGEARLDFDLRVLVPPRLNQEVESDVHVSEGGRVVLHCPAHGTPAPSILWIKDSSILEQSFTSTSPELLELEDVRRNDAGRYTCLATNEAGTLEHDYLVNVMVAPRLNNASENVVDREVVVNRPVTLSCFVVAHPPPTYAWFKDGINISTTVPGLSLEAGGRQLTLVRALEGDEGNYTCVATNEAGATKVTTLLKVLMPPQMNPNAIVDNSPFGLEGSELKVECKMEGSPPPSILWLKDGQLLQETNKISFFAGDRILHVRGLTPEDAGRYTCIASNAAGTSELDFDVRVVSPPGLAYQPQTSRTVLLNRAVSLDCPAVGNPEPTIEWMVDGRSLSSSRQFLRLTNGGRQLHILRVQDKDNGTVTCVLKNSVGEYRHNYTLEVLTPPTIIPSPTPSSSSSSSSSTSSSSSSSSSPSSKQDTVSVLEGEEVYLRCATTGHPTPEITWLVEGEAMTKDQLADLGIFLVEDGRALHLPDAGGHLTRRYTCIAANSAGSVEHSFPLSVILPPEIEDPEEGTNLTVVQNSLARFDCIVDARPAATLTWFKDDQPVDTGRDPFVHVSGGGERLSILRVLPHHAGKYTCLAASTAGEDALTYSLQVLIPPIILDDIGLTDAGRPEDTVGVVGGTVDLECYTVGTPTPSISWSKGGRHLTETGRLVFTEENQVLRVTDAREKDSGRYSCTASSPSGQATRDFLLVIQSPPRISDQLATDIVVNLHENVVLTCEAEGMPPPAVTWTRHGRTLGPYNHLNLRVEAGGRELHIDRIRGGDGGRYACSAVNPAGQVSVTYTVTVQVPPKIEDANLPAETVGVVGQDVFLECEASGNPSPDITWSRGNFSLTPEHPRYQPVEGQGTLVVKSVEVEDEGVFTCSATNPAGTVSRDIPLKVLVAPSVLPDARTEVTVIEGRSVVLDCPVAGDPEPTVEWSHGSVAISEAGLGNIYVGSSNSLGALTEEEPDYSLQVARATQDNAGVYTCRASNPAGTTNVDMTLKVLVPPEIEGGREEEIVTVLEGGHVYLECLVLRGVPPPERQWLAGPDLETPDHQIVGGGERLVVSKARLEDQGPYQCVASNEAGFYVRSFYLNIHTPPYINVSALEDFRVMDAEGGPEYVPPDGTTRHTSVSTTFTVSEGFTGHIPCPVTGNPAPRVLWYRGTSRLTKGLNYDSPKEGLRIRSVGPRDAGSYVCVAVNRAGEAQLTTNLAVVGKPKLEGDEEEEVKVVEGQSVILECNLRSSSSSSLLRGPPRLAPHNFTWTKNGQPLEPNLEDNSLSVDTRPTLSDSLIDVPYYDLDLDIHLYDEIEFDNSVEISDTDLLRATPSYQKSHDGRLLTLLSVRDKDEGVYQCIVRNQAGSDSKTFHVDMLVPPDIDTAHSVRKIVAATGEPVVLECNAQGDPPPQVSWFRGRDQLFTDSRLQLLEDDHVLIITSVQEGDGGDYTCLATNLAGVMEENFHLTVLVPPKIDNPEEEQITAVVGRPVKFKCEVGGHPPPEIVWTFDNERLISQDEALIIDGNELQIERLEADMAGRYRCDATNSVGRVTKDFQLQVTEAPFISGQVGVEVVTVVEGEAATLHCIASGHPKPVLSWSKDSVGVRLDSRVSLTWGGQTLLLQNVDPKDEGRYMCSASNVAGNATRLYRLQVLQIPRVTSAPEEVVAVSGEVVLLSCAFSGYPEPQVHWLQGDKPLPSELFGVTSNSSSPNLLPLWKNISFADDLEDHFEFFVPEGSSSYEESVTEAVQRTSEARLEVTESGAVRISPVRPKDAGNYTCVGDNEAGSSDHTLRLIVQTPPSVEAESNRVVVVTKGTAVLKCTAEGEPKPAITWRRGPLVISPSSEYEISDDGTTLIMRKVTQEKAGPYFCSASSSAGSSFDTTTLVVQEPPRVVARQEEVVAVAGREVMLECQVYGVPKPVVTWSRPDLAGAEVTPEDPRYQVSGGRLTIVPVAVQDMGAYECTAHNPAGTNSSTLQLTVHMPPSVEEALSEEVVAQRGETLSLSCTAAGYPPPSRTWLKNAILVNEGARRNIDTNGDLVINNVQVTDSGTYTCMVVNAAGRVYREIRVAVHVVPSFITLPRTAQVTRGERFVLTCEATGVPTPTITWLLNGTQVEGVGASSNGRSSLVVERAAKTDEGTYTCLARNQAGHRKAVAGIRVKVPPIIMDFPGEMTVQELSSVLLTCVSEGDPAPYTTWTKGGHSIAPTDRVHVMNNGSLMIDSSRASDAGEYKCVVSNDAGAAEATAHLKVNTPPTIIKPPMSRVVDVGETVVFDCVAEASPEAEITWNVNPGGIQHRHLTLTNGSLQLVAAQMGDEGQVVCQAFNDLGEDLAKADVRIRVPGMWGSWGPWSACSVSCGPGTQTRRRECNAPAPRNGGEPCSGQELQNRACRPQPCPVDGSWSHWQAWSECSETCGTGVRRRTRLCNDPAPLYGGQTCEDDGIEYEECGLRDCPVAGSWSEWSDWSDCSRSCGDGLRQRTRLCDNPPPSGGGTDCDGDALEVTPCSSPPCRIDGSWAPWGPWASCSTSCGGGIRRRRRECTDPEPSEDGRFCQGSDTLQEYCNLEPCPVHGGWSSWSSWGPCTATCGGGQRHRYRTCDNPVPGPGGRACAGQDEEYEACSSHKCPVAGSWGQWGSWSGCSVSCGVGIRERTRACNAPYPRFGGAPCAGDASESTTCEGPECETLPRGARGNLKGRLNGEDLGVATLTANVSTLGMQRTVTASVTPLIPKHATWMTPLLSVVSPVYWDVAYEIGGAVNGHTLTRGFFRRESRVAFATGEEVRLVQMARGVDPHGVLQLDVDVTGNVPYIPPGSFIKLHPYTEDYVQTGPGSLYAASSRSFSLGGFHLPYAWNTSITYDPELGTMPMLVEQLHANGLGAMYSNTLGDLDYIVSTSMSPGTQGSEECPKGFTIDPEGPFCRDDDECDHMGETICSHGCANSVGSFSCTCPTGYTLGPDGTQCMDVDECATGNVCGPRETCSNTPGSYTCVYNCAPGFRTSPSGTSCQDINECQEREGICSQTCLNLLGGFRCDCRRGYRLVGQRSCIDIDECAQFRSPCSHTCENTPGSFRCSCPEGFTLLPNGRCKDINECALRMHDCLSEQECRNLEGSYTCITHCPQGLIRADNGSCTDLDECQEQVALCHFSQICQNTWGSYRCPCPRGFISKGRGHPCLDVNECLWVPSPCSFQCRNTEGDFECICAPGQERLPDGKSCIGLKLLEESPPRLPLPPRRSRPPIKGLPSSSFQEKLLQDFYYKTRCPRGFVFEEDECRDENECALPERCEHRCENTYGSYSCRCPPGYRLNSNRRTCDDIDECREQGVSCGREKLCFNLRGSYKCISAPCPPDYQRDSTTGSCVLDCARRGVDCPPGVTHSHTLVFKTISLPAGILAYQDLVRLVVYDQYGIL
ncbi:hemicentin-1-like, partial [Oratosquilla oratoria]|uniref:hemicentin-1-like n=1 Tax=Oratosquilla oratoria TaxID=337810 RepID=UPI003F76D453